MKKIITYYFIFLLSFFSFFSAGVLDSVDGLQYLAVARNIYYRGEPTAPVYEYNTRENLHLSSLVGLDGKTYSMTGFGYSLAFLPSVFITDIVYKIYNIEPAQHFPLENDWVILFAASFTNSFFGALLGIILFVYFRILKLSVKQSLLLSFIAIVATNLFVYTKHSFAHMAFIVFEMLVFLLIKYYAAVKNSVLLFLAGICFGILIIIYNQTFILTIPPIILYYLLQIKPNWQSLRQEFRNVLYFFLGLLPFIPIYFWYENLRAVPTQNLTQPEFYLKYVSHSFSFPVGVFLEGIHGQLFSPGRSIFLYSPILLVILFFWMKIKKTLNPELFTFILLSIIYIIFYAMQYRIGLADQGISGNWHGELSWGPRYLTPLIPLGMIIVGGIYINLSQKQKLFVFYPLVSLGVCIQLLGIILPYQVKLHEMQHKIFLNGTEYFSSVYSDFLPRYNPILNMAKKLNKLRQEFPKYSDNGSYNLKLFDGIDFSFPVGNERWRVIENRGYISFDNRTEDPIREITLGLINHPVESSSESARLKFYLNEKIIQAVPSVLKIGQRELVKIPVQVNHLKETGNILVAQVEYDTPMELKFDRNPNVIVGRKQILGLMSIDINGIRQNMESIDVPYVSALGPKITGIRYENWGGTNKDPWKYWDIHTQTFERLPDLWWIRNLFYWDIPKNWIIGLFLINIAAAFFSGYKLFRGLKGS